MTRPGRYKYVSPEALAKLGRMNLVARAVVEGFVTGLHRSPYHGFSVEFAEHRQYVPGDDPKYLDWLALGRTDRYYVKKFQEETNLKSYILLDSSASMAFRAGEGGEESEDGLSKFEYGCYLAASLAFLMIRQQDSVGLATFADGIGRFIPPRSTPTHLNLLLRALEETAPAERAGTDLPGVFHQLAERIKRRGMIIVISDLFDDRREVMRGLSHFRHRKHEVLLFHLLHAAELNFPYKRLSDFIDMETGDRLQVDPNSVRREYMRQLQDFIDGYRRDCAQQGVDYVLADTSVPWDMLLFAYLGRRQRTA